MKVKWQMAMSKVYQASREVKVEDFPAAASLKDKAHYLLNYALLSPASHNTQPWLFHVEDDCVKVIINRSCVLGFVDPDYRDLIISCGAAICNFEVAARKFGLQTSVTICPDSDTPDLLVNISLTEGKPATDTEQTLFAAIKTRQTNRSPFTKDEVPHGVLADCIAITAGYTMQFNLKVL
jgi:hypothetical protein